MLLGCIKHVRAQENGARDGDEDENRMMGVLLANRMSALPDAAFIGSNEHI